MGGTANDLGDSDYGPWWSPARRFVMTGPVILVHLVMDEDRTLRACDGCKHTPDNLEVYPDTPRMLCPLCLAIGQGWHRGGNEACSRRADA